MTVASATRIDAQQEHLAKCGVDKVSKIKGTYCTEMSWRASWKPRNDTL